MYLQAKRLALRGKIEVLAAQIRNHLRFQHTPRTFTDFVQLLCTHSGESEANPFPGPGFPQIWSDRELRRFAVDFDAALDLHTASLIKEVFLEGCAGRSARS